jgi:competence protein ComEA
MPRLRRSHALIAAVAAFAIVLAAGEWWPARSGPSRLPPVPRATEPAPSAALVDVVGAVHHPGVYRLVTGARVEDAVQAAGGLRRTAARDAVNLAAAIVDGEQIVVPAKAHAGRQPTPAATASPVVHLNTADAAALDALPGVGPATASRIVAYRESHGPFARVDDLVDVPGIGPAKLDAMRGQLAL